MAGAFYDYYLVLDFEATCKQGRPPEPQEIIEFPVLKVNAHTFETEAIFHKYVSPTVHKRLSAFCTKLTGITQDMVDGQPELPEVLEDFDKWMKYQNLVDSTSKSCFVTCGDWDLKTMLPKECSYFGLDTHPYFNEWINIKRVFQEVRGKRPSDLPDMLSDLGLVLEGRHHSGIDDCKNIARILAELGRIKPDIHATGRLQKRGSEIRHHARP